MEHDCCEVLQIPITGQPIYARLEAKYILTALDHFH